MSLRRPTTRAAVLALAAGVLAVTGTPAAQADDAVAGGQTASPPDSLFPQQGNSGYDVSHYDIAFSADFTPSTANAAVGTSTIDATTTITASTTGAALSSYSFDFQGSTGNLAASTLNVTSVTVDGAPATFSRIENTTTGNATTDVHKLVVTPATPVSGTFTTVVKYAGRPVAHTDTDGSSEGWNHTTDGATFVNQPVGSMTLFPNNNTPRDTATYRFAIDIPSTLRTSAYAQAGGKPYASAAVSNGELVSRTPNGDGSRTTWVWEQHEPMASELSLVSIGRYDMYTSDITLASGRTIPEWTFIDPAISVANQSTTLGTRAQLASVIDFYETQYGPYPGNSTGLVTDVVPSAINYALETQDRPFFPNAAGRGTTWHEMMHQWWGDGVAPTDWNDISLNEGPAQYSEYQFPYAGAGSNTTTTEQQNYNLYTTRASAGAAPWTVAPGAMSQASQLFGSQSYERGSMALEALRTSIGAATFEKLMRTYQATYSGGQIQGRRLAAFKAMAEDLSGRDLGTFFTTWYYTTGRPAWPFKYNVDLSGPTLQVDDGTPLSYALSVRNTGKVPMTAGQAVISVDASDLLDDATLGALPAGLTQTGDVLAWSVPATAVGATSTVAIPATVLPGVAGRTLKVVATSTSLGGTCVVCTSSTPVGVAPILLSPLPTITGGTPTTGATLTADTTGWAPGTTFDYQWLVDGTPVPGATDATYVPTGDVVGLPVTVRVTGSLSGFATTTRTSAPTAPGVRATMPVASPTISGTPKIGVQLKVTPGTWPQGTVLTYQWRANGTAISQATGPVYTPASAAQVGQTIDVVVTGTKFGWTTVSRTSAATGAVSAGDALTSTPTPTISGTPRIGVAFAPDYGSWDDGTALTFQWRANGLPIAGATAGSFVPTLAQLGQTLDVVVTGTKPGIAAVVRTSNTSAAVDLGTQSLQPTPTITGTPRPLSTVTGVPGTWDTGTTHTYKWYLDGVEVPLAVLTTFTPELTDIGKSLTFEVTSTRPGYATVTRSSAPSTVLALPQVLTPTPTVVGIPRVGLPVVAVPGLWDLGTTLAYQWLADGTPIAGATSATYVPGVQQLGSQLAVRVTSSKPDYEDVVRTSDLTVAVAKGDLTDTPVPTISGTPKVGVELSAVPGAWDLGTLLSYQWYADGEAVDGATSSTWTPGPGRVGQVVTVAVTGVKTGFEQVTRTSLGTVAVVKGTLLSTPLPTITGTPRVGSQLGVVPGTWDDGVDLGYQWFADGEAIDGATSSTYVPGPGRTGQVVTVAVTGVKAGYETVVRTSAATSAVLAGDLGNAPVPTITGTPKVGVPLTAVPGAWDAGTVLGFQWLADGTPVSGATSSTFTPTAAQQGDTLTVEVTGTLAGFLPITKVSLPTAAVALGDLLATPVPTVTGTPKVDVPLTAVPGTWDAGTALGFQWLADGQLVPGATASTFTPGAAQQGRVLTVEVTGTLAGYLPVTKASLPTAAVALGDLVATPVPTITGTPKVDAALTALPGVWDTGTALVFQWSVADVPVVGATGSTYVVRAVDAGKAVTVSVTGTLAGYLPASRTSAASGAVADGDLASAPTPTLVGTPQVDQELRADPGAWDGGTALAYRWTRDGSPIAGVTGSTYRATAADLGRTIAVVVTGSKAGYTSLSRTSAGTVVVAASQALRPRPTISGKAKVGKRLRARPGTHDAGVTVTYLWQAGTKKVGTGRTLVLTRKLEGKRIRLTTTATKPGYGTVVARSARSGKVAPR